VHCDIIVQINPTKYTQVTY